MCKCLLGFVLASRSGRSATIPDFHSLVHRTGDNRFSPNSDRRHKVSVDIEELPGAAGRGQVPHAHALVVADRDQELSIRMETDVRHPIIMPY